MPTATERTVTGPKWGSASIRPASHYRWVILALIFFATTINYVDRQVLGILAPTLEREIGWTEEQYSFIVMSFSLAYALSLTLFGWVVDKIGSKMGYLASIVWWSLAAMAHALAKGPFSFGIARVALGLGEAGNFPTAIKVVTEWFPKKERALATGIFNGGTNIGAILAPLIVPWLTVTYGWQEAFIVTGALGFLWVVAWALLYREPDAHPRVSASELAYIRQDPAEPVEKIPWVSLLGHRQTWAYAVAKMMTDPIWWFFLFWLPKYLDKQFGVTLHALAAPIIVVYLVSDAGSILGGGVSSFMIKRGFTVNRSRKTAMGLMALLVVPMILPSFFNFSMWGAITIVAIAAAAHQGWSANVYTMVSDMFPKRAVGSVVGFGGMFGAAGAFTFQLVIGQWLQYTTDKYGAPNYTPLFVICGLAYVSALLIVHLIVPRMTPAKID